MTRMNTLWALFVAVTGGACVPAGYYGPEQTGMAGFQPVRLPELGFAIDMPGRPAIEHGTEVAEDGGSMRTTSALVGSDTVAFGFVVLEDELGMWGHPMTEEGAVVRVGGVAGASDGWEVARSAEHEHEGYRAFEVVRLNRTQGVVSHGRVFLGKKRFYVAFVVHAIAADAAFAQYRQRFFGSVTLDPRDAESPRGDGRLDLVRWRHIHPPEADFAVAMPGDARRWSGKLQVRDTERDANTYVVSDGSRSFAVGEIRFGERPQSEVIDARSRELVEGGMRIQRDEETQVQGFAGRTLTLTSDTRVMEVHYFLTAGRLYEVRVSTPEGDELGRQAAERFFDSFRIL